MRGRLSFVLTALTLLFLLEGVAVLLATLFATASAAIHPHFRPLALLPALLPVAALLAPALPLTRAIERRTAIAVVAVLVAVVRVPLSLPQHELRLITASVLVAAGLVFLSLAVGFLERRSVAGGIGAALVLDQLLRLAGWGWDVTLRTLWVAPQLVLSGAVVLLALAWLHEPMPESADADSSYERRAGGLRLRGGLALALLLFIDLNVLARPEVASRWFDVSYEGAAVLFVSAGLTATLLLLAGPGPAGRHRPAALAMALLVGSAVLLARVLPPWGGVALMAAGHGAAVLLVGRSLVPSTGRRKGGTLAVSALLWLVLNVLYTATFFPAFTLPLLAGAAPWLCAFASLLLIVLLMLLPRPVETPPPLQGRLYVGLAVVVVAGAVVLLALRQRMTVADGEASHALRVATYNVHHGFDGEWRYDPAAIAAVIRDSGADVVALQELGALPAAYGTDLPLYLARKLGMRVYFAPTHNGLSGDAVLSAVQASGFTRTALPGERVLVQLTVPLAGEPVHVFASRLGLSAPLRLTQMDSVLAVTRGTARAVLMGDLNAEPGDSALGLLRRAGFRDAFELAGSPPAPTTPAERPARRIDWIWTRGLPVQDAGVLPAAASDHRLVRATVRIR